MVTKERVSRWFMYVGLLSILSTIPNGGPTAVPLSFTFGLLLVGQYAVLQFYNGYERVA